MGLKQFITENLKEDRVNFLNSVGYDKKLLLNAPYNIKIKEVKLNLDKTQNSSLLMDKNANFEIELKLNCQDESAKYSLDLVLEASGTVQQWTNAKLDLNLSIGGLSGSAKFKRVFKSVVQGKEEQVKEGDVKLDKNAIKQFIALALDKKKVFTFIREYIQDKFGDEIKAKIAELQELEAQAKREKEAGETAAQIKLIKELAKELNVEENRLAPISKTYYVLFDKEFDASEFKNVIKYIGNYEPHPEMIDSNSEMRQAEEENKEIFNTLKRIGKGVFVYGQKKINF